VINDTFEVWRGISRDVVQNDYHVILSPTWQVPVLYFAPRWSETLEPLTLKEVYSFLVQESSKDVLEDVGVLGGISHGVLFRFLLCVDSRIILCWESLTTSFTRVGRPIYWKVF
jgi:hypothetical protein